MVCLRAERPGQRPTRRQGLVEVTTSWPPTATHRLGVGHEIPPDSWFDVSTVNVAHPDAGPVGSVVVTMSVATSSPTQSPALGQISAASGAFESTPVVGFQADAPPVGLVDVNTKLPALPVASAAQRVAVGHVTGPISLDPPAGESTAASVHAEVPPVGFVDVTRFPSRSAATQSEASGQAIDWNPPGFAPSAATTFQPEAGPVGAVVVTMLPSWSAPTQRVALGHAIAPKTRSVSTSIAFHADAPPVGSVDTATCPTSSPAMQRVVDGQAMALIELVLSMSTVVQAEAPPVGFVEINALPPLSTATQRFAAGQATAVSPFCSLRVTAVQVGVWAVGVDELCGRGVGVRVGLLDD